MFGFGKKPKVQVSTEGGWMPVVAKATKKMVKPASDFKTAAAEKAMNSAYKKTKVYGLVK